jgi:hypothetical protein
MVDIQPQSTQPISDDQELAKVLAGVTEQVDEVQEIQNPDSQVAPPTPVADLPSAPAEPPVVDLPTPNPSPALADETPIGYNPPTDTPIDSSVPATNPSVAPLAPSAVSGDLEGIKKDALNELRPLVDKLQLEPEEKFDTYLLLLRSTDDKELIAPAHAAARAIPDETRRAQALLDINKEIDFLSNSK